MESPSRSTRFDFLSDLPESISHKILSLLDIKHVARVSTLSRICRKNCLSSPFLTIDLGEFSGQEFYRFSSFLHRFMSSRNGVGVHQFKLKMDGGKLGDDDEFHIGNWILEATKCNVEKIVLRMNSLKIFSLPSGVLYSASLRYLEVRMSGGLLNLPTTSFGGLENLKLRNVQVTIKFGEWISRCKSLKMLYLSGIVGVEELYICSSSLEDFRLYTTIGFINFKIKVSAERLKYLLLVANKPLQLLKLHAPKLEQFSCRGFVSHYSCEGNLESLYHSDISMKFYNEHRVRVNGIIGKVLQSMYRVSSIIIQDYSIEEISRQGLLPEFCNLRSLTLIRNHSGDKKFQSTICLLTSMPHLNTLKIKGFRYSINDENEEENNCYNAKYWESQNLKFVHSLKEFEMEFNGEQNGIELIKYLLKNAEALKRMTIHYSRLLPYRQSEISRKIQEFQIASSSIAMSFFHHHW